MSRLKQIKEKRKQKIKSTIMGLALTIFIGATGVLGSYAWFISNDIVENNLSVTMGSLDVEIINDEIYECTKPECTEGIESDEKMFHQDFEIKNTGTLDQDVELNIIYEATNQLYSKKIKYQLYSVDKEGNELYLKKGTLSKSNEENILSMRLSSSVDSTESVKNFRLKMVVESPNSSLSNTDINVKLIAEAVNTNKSKSQGGVK